MLVWLRQVSKEHNVSVEFVPEVFQSSEQIVQSIRKGLLDAFTLTTPEYPLVSDFVDPQWLLVDDYGGDTGEEYLILVPQDSPIHSVTDLRGRNIVLLDHPGMCLAPAWLGTLLAPLGARQPEQFFASLKRESKLSNVVLPVFFRKTDAGMVTRRGFESVCELNPQVAKQVRILAISPKFVRHFMAFSKKYHARNRDELQQALLALSSTATGRQLLTMFHSRQLTTRPASCLDASLDLLRRYNRIQAARVSAAAGTAGQTSREVK